jgi:pyruvate ferredoxin oxidoreductase beta subunit
MRKGKIKTEPINVIGIGGDGGIADMGLSAVSATLTWPEYNSLIIMYDNESYANTGVQVSCQTPYGAHTTFSPVGSVKPIMHKRWKKNTAAMLAAGHPECRYVASACTAYPVDLMNKVRRALSIGGPTFVAVLCPCPKGWDFDPRYSHEMGELACKSGMWANWEMMDGKLTFQTPSSGIIKGMVKRIPVTDYLMRQGRFDHLRKEDFDHIQKQLDKIWGDWGIPAILPFKVAEGELA